MNKKKQKRERLKPIPRDFKDNPLTIDEIMALRGSPHISQVKNLRINKRKNASKSFDILNDIENRKI